MSIFTYRIAAVVNLLLRNNLSRFISYNFDSHQELAYNPYADRVQRTRDNLCFVHLCCSLAEELEEEVCPETLITSEKVPVLALLRLVQETLYFIHVSHLIRQFPRIVASTTITFGRGAALAS